MAVRPPTLRSFDLSPRDRSVVQLVARFRQVSSTQVHELLFHDKSSHTPGDRALRRLVEQQFLLRVERRIVGGAGGGAGVYVYQLGRRGFYLYYEGRFNPWRRVNYHALGIVDVYVQLRRLERAGLLSIVGLSTEPDCWVRIGGDELKPDLYVELTRPGRDISIKIFFEVDMGTEGQKHIKDKLARYWRCLNAADGEQWPEFPNTLWVAVDAERQKELRWLISSMPADAQRQFRVTTLEHLPVLFGG